MRTFTLASVLVCFLSAVVFANNIVEGDAGCNVDLFRNDEMIWEQDLFCWDQADYPQYRTERNGYGCSTQCKVLVGVESASKCHDLVKNSRCGASFFSFVGSKCWAKSGYRRKRRSGAVNGAIQTSNCVPEDDKPELKCRWEETKDADLAATHAYVGWTCASNEILIGFQLQATEDDVTKVRCCQLGGHSSVVPDTCSFVDFKDPDLFNPEQASCNANDHMVFSGAYDERIAGPVDGYTEIKVGKCCEVKCDAPWCAGKDWGVNTEKCQTISKDPNNHGMQELVCPKGTLLTQIHDGHKPDQDSPHAIQIVESVVCCALDVIAKPTKAPTTSPTPSPTRSPSPSPTEMPSPSPTTAPTTKEECLHALRCVADMTDAEWLAAIEKCCGNSDNHRRALTGRLLPEDVERMM